MVTLFKKKKKERKKKTDRKVKTKSLRVTTSKLPHGEPRVFGAFEGLRTLSFKI